MDPNSKPSVVSDWCRQENEKTRVSDVGGSSSTITEKLRERSNSLRAMSSETISLCKRQAIVDSAETQYSILKAYSTELKTRVSDVGGFSDVGGSSSTITEKLREISNSLRAMSSETRSLCKRQATVDSAEPQYSNLKAYSTELKKSLVQECVSFLNNANKEELLKLKGIGEKRASYIIKLRAESPQLFKQLDDLKGVGLSPKEIRMMMSGLFGDF